MLFSPAIPKGKASSADEAPSGPVGGLGGVRASPNACNPQRRRFVHSLSAGLYAIRKKMEMQNLLLQSYAGACAAYRKAQARLKKKSSERFYK